MLSYGLYPSKQSSIQRFNKQSLQHKFFKRRQRWRLPPSGCYQNIEIIHQKANVTGVLSPGSVPFHVVWKWLMVDPIALRNTGGHVCNLIYLYASSRLFRNFVSKIWLRSVFVYWFMNKYSAGRLPMWSRNEQFLYRFVSSNVCKLWMKPYLSAVL